jgi:hypothetical protein
MYVAYRRVQIDEQIYCTIIQLVTTIHKPLYGTLCLLISIIFHCRLNRFPPILILPPEILRLGADP